MVLSTVRRRDEMTRMSSLGAVLNVAMLAERFEVSTSTIRRDLAHLEAEGHVTRTYGGAVSSGSHAESNLQQRLGEKHEAKIAIGAWAAEQIESGESVMLEAGSTVAAVAHHLRRRSGLTVNTTSLAVIAELSRNDQIVINVLGGTLRPVSQSVVGAITLAAVEGMTFDRLFLGADSVDAEFGICEADAQQTSLKQLLARRARAVYVLAHAEKIGRRPFHAWAQLPLPWTLVTNAADNAVKPFIDRGVNVVRVGR